jgi:hypothetical protein
MENCLMTEQKLLLLDNILRFFDMRGFSRNEAAKIVGGRRKLELLIERGDVEVDTTCRGKWQCRGEQVLRHMKRLP